METINTQTKYAGLSDFLNKTDFGYQLGSTGKYTLPAGALLTMLGSYLNWANAKSTKVEGETEEERRKRLWKAAIVPTALGGLATLAGTTGIASLASTPTGLASGETSGFMENFKKGLKGSDAPKSKSEPGILRSTLVQTPRSAMGGDVPYVLGPSGILGLGFGLGHGLEKLPKDALWRTKALVRLDNLGALAMSPWNAAKAQILKGRINKALKDVKQHTARVSKVAPMAKNYAKTMKPLIKAKGVLRAGGKVFKPVAGALLIADIIDRIMSR